MIIARLPSLELRPEDALELARMLDTALPEIEVRAFGSRVTGHAKACSDLDLAIITDTPLSMERLAVIVSAFEESDLSICLDVVE